MEKQKTIFGTFKSPVSHPNDLVTCDDGQEHPRWSVWPNCKGEHNIYACDRDVIDCAEVEALLDKLFDASEEYHENNKEFADELREQLAGQNLAWRRGVAEWVMCELGDWEVSIENLPPNPLACNVISAINPAVDADAIQNSSDFREYAGEGVLAWSMKIGEVEHQIEIKSHPILLALHEANRLDSVLDRVHCEGVVSRNSFSDGPETCRAPLESGTPSLSVTFAHCGGWDFVLREDCLRQKLAECVLAYHGYRSEPLEVINGKGSDANQVPG